jgi:hypothetical protein
VPGCRAVGSMPDRTSAPRLAPPAQDEIEVGISNLKTL